jgi:CcmD family protein
MTKKLRVVGVALFSVLSAVAAGAQDGFVPVDSLPPTEQLPAAPLLVAAYAFVWVALMVYLWSIWRRLGKVEDEMRALESRLSKRSTTR